MDMEEEEEEGSMRKASSHDRRKVLA